jgi:hypothetical protein
MRGVRSFGLLALGTACVLAFMPSAAGSKERAVDEATLAARFRPLLFFDGGEHWRPISVESLVADDQAELCANGSPCFLATSLQQIANFPGGRLNISGNPLRPSSYHSKRSCVSGKLLDCDSGPDARLYYHVVTHGAYRYIDYWDYYRLNDTPYAKSIDEHESDWEGLAVAIPTDDPNPATFSFVEFAAHRGVYRYLRSALLCGAATRVNCGHEAVRVRAYIARGTHATYPQPCAGKAGVCKQNDLPWVEGAFGGTEKWGANEDPAALEPFPTTGWPFWRGVWDSFPRFYPGRKPAVRSPGTQLRFERPWSATCVQRWSGQAEPGDCLPGTAGPADPCASWAGPFTTAVVCDPTQLAADLATSSLPPGASVIAPQPGQNAGAVKGLTQILGPPLSPGQTIILRSPPGASPGTRVYVRVQTGQYYLTAGFDQAGIGQSREAEVKAGATAQGKPTAEIIPLGINRLRPVPPIKPAPRLTRLLKR